MFLLYKQEGKVDMESELREDPLNLKDRTFSTLDFYSTYQVGFFRKKESKFLLSICQDHITPAGLAFCQSDYEASILIVGEKCVQIKFSKPNQYQSVQESLRNFFHHTLNMKEPR